MKRKIRAICLLVSLSIFVSGCLAPLVLVGVGAGAGIGSYRYVNGEIVGIVDGSFEKTWNATLLSFKDLSFSVNGKSKFATEGEINAVNLSGKKVVAKLKKISDTSTEVRIRIGTFGDETQAHAILNKIGSNL